jgi:tetrahydromethanopterin S-methyltransferase subunit G
VNNEEKILQLLEAQQEELRKINDRLEKLEEHAEVTRAGVNSLLDWAEECGNVIKFPLPKVK